MAKYRFSMRDVAAIGGGIAAGVIASRLLPPLAAQASGAVRARLGEDPFERLIRDHRYVQSVLREMEEVPEGSAARRAKLYLELKRALAKHALAEEDIVYPMLRQQAGDMESSKHLYDEHAEIKVHLYEIEQLLMHNANWSERVRSLRSLIDGHIRDEEEVQFPKLRRSLDQRGTRTLTRNVRREEALVL